jgi:paraquat-inducible protein A
LLLSATTLILFIVANTYPLLTFKLQGREQVASMITGVRALFGEGFWELAILVVLCSIVIPLTRILTGLYLFLPLRFGRVPWGFARLFPVFRQLAPWAMTEVYLLGLIVAYVKLTDLATLVVGVASYALMGLIVITTWSTAVLDPRTIWNRAREIQRRRRAPDDAPALSASGGAHLACHHCQLIVRSDGTGHGPSQSPRCPRCRSALHHRKPNSIARVWALLLAAAILYIPANLLPVMTVISFGEGEPDTILSGVKALITAEMYPVAILVFMASIFVPVLKILVMALLLVSVQWRSHWRPRQRTLLYRITESVGRWSMIDIFMISILAGLVRLGSIATIEPGLGALFFAAVVILTMIAASAFDPRLIWDALADDQSRGPRGQAAVRR